MSDSKDSSNKASDFAAGAQEESSGLMSEFMQFLKHNKKWWLLPILLVLLVVGVLVGTYSSIYVAASMLVALKIDRADLILPEPENAEQESIV